VAWGEEIVEAGEHPLRGNRVGRVCQHSALAILSSTAWSTKAKSGITLVRFLSCVTVPKKPAGGSGLRGGWIGSRGALPLQRALHGAAGQSSSPWVWARCWVKCWACRADISSPAPAFSRCSHLLQRSGSGSPTIPTIPTRTRVCCRQELGSARYARAMALGARVSVGVGCTCASCNSAQPSSERAPRSSQHVELLTRCSDVGCAT